MKRRPSQASLTTRVSLALVAAGIILLVGAVGASYVIAINLQQYAALINESGRIRGGIQRVVKLYLADALSASDLAMVDASIHTLDGFCLRHAALAGLSDRRGLQSLSRQWSLTRAGLADGSLSRTDAVKASESLWLQSDALVASVQRQTRGQVALLRYTSAATIAAIVLMMALALVFRFLVQGRIEIHAYFDPLTGLLNRNQVEVQFRRGWKACRRSGEGFAVLLCDIDHFKAINDDFGHGAGDEVLQRVAETIKASARSADAVFRYGGEEFLVFTSYRKTAELMEYAERLCRNVEAGHFLERQVTLSIGVAPVEGNGSLQEAIAVADTALYRAKQGGRNQVVL